MMRAWILAVLVLLVLSPGATAISEVDRLHVKDEYRIPYNIQLGGVGGGLFQGDTILSITYEKVIADSDEADDLDAATGVFAVNVFGPGSNIAGSAATISIVSSDCGAPVLLGSSSGLATTRSWSSAHYSVSWDNSAADVDQCRVVVQVVQTGATAFTFRAPITFFNDDVKVAPTPFQVVFNMTGLELLPLLLAALIAMALTMTLKHRQIRVGAGLVLIVLGVVFLLFLTPINLALATLFGVIGGVSILFEFLSGLEEGRTKRKPRQFFE